MLTTVKELQSNAVKKLIKKISFQNEVTFKAPTGSGKTYMMADFMNQILTNNKIIFLVSTLSKADLGKQNFEKFIEYSGIFNNMNPYMINSDVSDEQKIYIPDDYNVYVLPRDLYKDKSRIKNNNALMNFLLTIKLQGKSIYLVKDESHIATNNLDELNDLFEKVINFSATPKFFPDVEITNEEAINSKLIKSIADTGDEDNLFNVNQNDNVEDAIDKFLLIKKDYINKLKINPCLIIQISNKDKAENEWDSIKKIIEKKSANLKWMYIVDDNAGRGSDTNDEVKKIHVSKWKDYVKSNVSLIDIIVFKMVITEGWDIPRACMLYQVRDSKSKQMDEQVIGRVRRNPILLNFEDYDSYSQKLALTAWVWGIIDSKLRNFKKVNLKKDINFNIVTTKLTDIYKRENFNISKLISSEKKTTKTTSIFDLHKKWNEVTLETKNFSWKNIKNYSDWINVSEVIDLIDRENNKYLSDYQTSLVADKNSTFSTFSYFEITNIVTEIDNWVWSLNDKDDVEYHFDSQAEKEFVKLLKKLKTPNWGKNYYPNSTICFEYMLFSKHSSYPDFILKDKNNKIHIFEVKSINKSENSFIDEEEYNEKIVALKSMFAFASLASKQYFYLPIRKDSDWIIFKYDAGIEFILNQETFITSMLKLL